MTVEERILEALSDLSSSEPIEPAALYAIQRLARASFGSGHSDDLTLFVIGQVFGILADRLDRQVDQQGDLLNYRALRDAVEDCLIAGTSNKMLELIEIVWPRLSAH